MAEPGTLVADRYEIDGLTDHLLMADHEESGAFPVELLRFLVRATPPDNGDADRHDDNRGNDDNGGDDDHGQDNVQDNDRGVRETLQCVDTGIPARP